MLQQLHNALALWDRNGYFDRLVAAHTFRQCLNNVLTIREQQNPRTEEEWQAGITELEATLPIGWRAPTWTEWRHRQGIR